MHAVRKDQEETTLLYGRTQDLLGVPRVSVLDNFFELGGHSLLAAQMVARLAQTTDIRLDLRSVIFETLEQLAAGSEGRSEAKEWAGAGS